MSDELQRPVRLKPCCQNLRHKMMYVDERQSTPGWVNAIESDSRVYICTLTQETLGPDGETVRLQGCSDSGDGTRRACYRGISTPILPTIDGAPAGNMT